MGGMSLTVYHIPVCPFSQRLEILLALKGLESAARFVPIDITVPRPDWLLEKTGGTTALPVAEADGGLILRESLVLMRYIEARWPQPPVAQTDPGRHAIEDMLVLLADPLAARGYGWVMNQDATKREAMRAEFLAVYAQIDAFLRRYGAGSRPFLFERFGWAEAAFTPLFVRFAFLDYYEGFEWPDDPAYARVRQWVEACLAHPAAQQVSAEEVVKLYHDYALGAGNGALVPGRARSSFVFEPHWRERPWPPKDKYGERVSDSALGLVE